MAWQEISTSSIGVIHGSSSMNVRRRAKSEMTLSVYRITIDGEREELKPLQRYEMSAPAPMFPPDPPCECDHCDSERLGAPLGELSGAETNPPNETQAANPDTRTARNLPKAPHDSLSNTARPSNNR